MTPHYAGNFMLITNRVKTRSENEPFGQYCGNLYISLFPITKVLGHRTVSTNL